MSTKASLTIFGIVALSLALIVASLPNLAIAANTGNNDNGKGNSDKGSSGGKAAAEGVGGRQRRKAAAEAVAEAADGGKQRKLT